MHKTYTLSRPYGLRKGRFFWQESPEPKTKKGICFVPESLFENLEEFDRIGYLDQGWARLNCSTNPNGVGSHMFPNMQKPVLEETPVGQEKVKHFVDRWG